MSFVGPAHRLGEAWVRPHDVDIRHEPNGQTIEAMVDRIVHLGFEVRVELTLTDGDQFSVQLTRDEVEELELEEGQIVFVRPRSTRVFAPDGRGAKVTTQPEVA
jgi:sulfate transport system ATP-binding protein